MHKPDNQMIQCGVKSCQFNDQVKYCMLDHIQVGPNGDEARTKHETDCLSFEPRIQ
ncbi:MAG: DUF1540 domain-containing protein [Epulopiscium sp.]|nr:DUF1540 domain-containing protein [Candidatus Epulonipiscium sp.]